MTSPADYLPLAADPCPPTHNLGSSFEGFFHSPQLGRHHSAPLPANQPDSASTHAPGDLILIVCELQSAPPEQRICLYMRWIAHGHEAQQLSSRSSSSLQGIGNGIRPPSSRDKGKQKQVTLDDGNNADLGDDDDCDNNDQDKSELIHDPSFEIIHYIPRWRLKLGAKVTSSSVQPFRIDLSSSQEVGELLGSFEILANGNLDVDLTVPAAQPARGGTRVQIRTQHFCPWSKASASDSWYERLPLGSKGPEGLLQHLGLALPLHWYVHTTQSPAIYSIQHVTHASQRSSLSSSPTSSAASNLEHGTLVSAGLASVHVEKNWGHSFPTGWLWSQASSQIPPNMAQNGDASNYFAAQPHMAAVCNAAASTVLPKRAPPDDNVRISLAGGSILGLTAFLVGIRIGERIAWDFRPPFAVGPGKALQDGPTAWIHYGLGLKVRRDYPNKSVRIEVWDLTHWARLDISGDPNTFATDIPGPCLGEWTPGYCHHSYRCRITITLFERPLALLASTIASSTLASPGQSWSDLKTLLGWSSTPGPASQARTSPGRHRRRARRTASMDPDPRLGDLDEESEDQYLTLESQATYNVDQAWCRTFGWRRVGQWSLDDRVALEFGGDFAA
ncbi:hypothetical protein ACQY0O_006642 [Thecaphora frezii]